MEIMDIYFCCFLNPYMQIKFPCEILFNIFLGLEYQRV